MRFSLLPRNMKFFILFEQSAENTLKMARQLNDVVNIWENVKARFEVIADMEQQGDAITHLIMRELYVNFVTPVDREDISQLAESMDDVADLIHAAADAMLFYKVDRPGDRTRELANVIVQSVIEINDAMPELERGIDKNKILARCKEINRLENVADGIYRSALAELFVNNTDYPYIIKWREIYKHLETVTDKCEDVANVLEGIALKYG